MTTTLPFAPEDQQEAILALRAVVTEIASVPETVSDPEVGRTKLEWWRRALDENLPHPAVEALLVSGAAGKLPPARFSTLIDAVAATLENPRFENRERAWAFCLQVGGPVAALEAELAGAGETLRTRLKTLGGTAYLVRVVRDLAIDARNHRWMVPLDLQAEYQVSRRDALAERAGPGWNGMVRGWLADGLKRAQAAVRQLAPEDAWSQRHLLIQYALDERLAAKLAGRPERILRERVLPGQPGNAWRAWQTARRLRRRVVNKAGLGNL